MRRTLCIGLFILISQFLFGQDDILDMTKSIEPIEPSAAALGKYGTYPVNYSSGLPNIEIPIYTVRSGDLQIPIKLSYHGGGIQVSEDASWVGLGWSLSYGGEITRQVNGRPDVASELSRAPSSGEIVDYMDAYPKEFHSTYLMNLVNEDGGESNMRDVFHFNLSGGSGQFVYDDNGFPLQIPFGDYKIDFNGAAKNTIILPNGTKYEFTNTDQTQISPMHSSFSDFISTWKVSRISSATGIDEINYSYQPDGTITKQSLYSYEGFVSVETENDGYPKPATKIALTNGKNSQRVTSKKPQTIEFPNGRVSFVLGARDDIYCDISTEYQDKRLQKLDEILVEEKINGDYIVKERYVFTYSYVQSGTVKDPRDPSKIHPNYLKLKLDRVTKYDKLYSEEDGIVIADFNYYESGKYPTKDSYSVDYWGFYNGVSNSTPIPLTTLGQSGATGTISTNIGGADRDVIASKAQISSLKTITYPTGGKTTFRWESNRSGADEPVVTPSSKYTVISVCGNKNKKTCSDPETSPTLEEMESPEFVFDNGSVSETFTNYIGQSVDLIYYIEQHIDYEHQHNKYDKGRLILKDLTSNTTILDYYIRNNGTQIKNVYLNQNHRYYVEATSNCENLTACLSFEYNSYDPNDNKYNYPVGGLRVSAIENYDSDDAIISKKVFTYKVPDTERSSGFLTSRKIKTYVDIKKSSKVVTINGSQTDGAPGRCSNEITTTTLACSNAVCGMSSNTVTYQYVQVFDIDELGNNNGYTEYEFDVCEDDFISDHHPVVSKSWNRGQLKRESIYEKGSDSYTKAKETFNYYSIDKSINNDVRNLKVVRGLQFENYCDYFNIDVTVHYFYVPLNYYYSQKWKHRDSTETIIFDKIQDSLVNKQYFYYDSNNYSFPNRETTIGSTGEIIESITKYPLDYIDGISSVSDDNVQHTAVMQKMKSNNMLALPIETIKKSGEIFLEARHNDYNETSDHINLTKIYVQKNTNLLGSNNITYPNQSDLSLLYNTDGKIKQALGITGILSTYWWGYENQFTVAKIVNLKDSEISASLQSLLNQLDDYTLLSTTDKENLKALNANIRAALPDDAQISTYTYSPLTGMTSQTDPNGITNYYEYDRLGRLLRVLNQDNKIVKEYFNHYHNGVAYPNRLRSSVINITQPTNGKITPGSMKLDPDQSQNFQIAPNANYKVKNVIIDGITKGPIQSFTLAGDQDHSVSAEMELVSYKITASSGSNGSITPTAMVTHGSSKTFTMTPSTGYKVKRVLVDNVSVGVKTSYSFSNVIKPHSISVEFETILLDLSTSSGSGGSISASSKVSYGSNGVVTITPNTGYHISNVSANRSYTVSGNTYTFQNVTSGVSITATFAIDQIDLITSSGSGGSISASSKVSYGSSGVVTITPNTGYHISNVNANQAYSKSGNNYTFSNVTSRVEIHVDFAIDTFEISSTHGGNGEGFIAGCGTVNYGSIRQVLIEPDQGSLIDNVKIDGVSQGSINSYMFRNITDHHSIHVDFVIQTYELRSSQSGGGSITSSATIASGGSKTFTISASSGFNLSDVLVDGVSQGAISSYTFSGVNSDHTIHAIFEKQPFRIHSNWTGDGTITRTQYVEPGGNVTFEIRSSVYVKKNFSVYVDGYCMGAIYSYTFSNVTSNHEIFVDFTDTCGGDGGEGM